MQTIFIDYFRSLPVKLFTWGKATLQEGVSGLVGQSHFALWPSY